MRPAQALLFLILSGLSCGALEPTPGYEGKLISEVDFLPTKQPLPPDELGRLAALRIGQPLRMDEVRAALRALYRTGEYDNVEVDAEQDADGRIRLTFHTTEQYFIGAVEVQGKVSVPPSRAQIANASGFGIGAPFRDEDIQNALVRIERLLDRNGLYLSRVEPKIERDAEHQQVMIAFEVEAGKRARFTQPIVTGDTRIPPDQVAKAAKFKSIIRWKQDTQANAQAALQKVRKKYAKEERLTATVANEKMEHISEGNRVRATIRVDGGPKVTIRAEGAKISNGKLQEYVPVFDQGTVNRDLLVRGVANLRDYFQSKGYFDVQVNVDTQDVDPDHEVVRYTIGLGQRLRLTRVDVVGNRYFATSAIRERMFLRPNGFIRLRHGRYSDGFARRDEDALTALYQENGFQDVKVSIVPASDRGKMSDIAVQVKIDEGPQYRVAQLILDGVDHLDKEQLSTQLSSGAGQPYSAYSVALDRGFLLAQYQSAAYLDAKFTSQAIPGPGPHEVTLRYSIVEGQPRYVRDIVFHGLHNTRRSLLDRSVVLEAGAPLSWKKIGDMQRGLYDLGVFDSVDVGIQNPDGDAKSKYVVTDLTEGHRYLLGIGFGAEFARIGGSQNSLNNPGGAAGFAPRVDLDVSRMNMFGLGHSLDFKSRYSTLDRRVSLDYSIPHFRDVAGRNITITALYDNTRDVLTYTGKRIEGSAQITKKLSKASTALFRYTWRDVQVDSGTLKINPLLIPALSQPARLGILSTTWVQDRRDNPTNATRGIYNSVNLEFVDRYFGGNRNFSRVLARNSYYKRIGASLVIASNTEAGWIRPFGIPASMTASDPLAASNYVPLPERFFGGGSTSLRGFPDNQAGPRDLTTGFPVGGNALLFHSTELRFPLMGDNIDGVVFHDMGNIYSSLRDISFRVHQNGLKDFNYMVHAPGFGIRYRTPLGPVRLDLAYSINPPTFNGLSGTYQQLITNTATAGIQHVSHFQFFFSIGQAF